MANPLKLYRFFLKLYPARFREEYCTLLEQEFSDEFREAGGTLQRFAMWVRTFRDLAISIPLELAHEMRQDLSYSIRIYSRRPGVTFLAVAAMALANRRHHRRAQRSQCAAATVAALSVPRAHGAVR